MRPLYPASRIPRAIASAACDADSVPLNLSGAIIIISQNYEFFRQLWSVPAKIQAMRVHRNETPEILDDKFAKKLRGCLIIIVNDRVVYFMLRCSL
jgi:hypothetical protein